MKIRLSKSEIRFLRWLKELHEETKERFGERLLPTVHSVYGVTYRKSANSDFVRGLGYWSRIAERLIEKGLIERVGNLELLRLTEKGEQVLKNSNSSFLGD